MLNSLKDKISERVKRSDFLKNSLIMVIGTSLAQIIPILAYPVITRLYSPSQFGIYQLIFSIVILLGNVSGLKYDAAIILPYKDEDADNLFILSFVIAIILNFALFITIPLWIDFFLNITKNEGIRSYVKYIPFINILIFLFVSLTFYLIRKKEYKIITTGKIIKSSTQALFQIFFGLIKLVNGLIIGFIISFFIGSSYYALKTKILKIIKKYNRVKIKALIRRYSRFPQYTLPSNFLHKFNISFFYLLIASFYGNQLLGLFSLAHQILNIPISFISVSISQVFYQEFSERLKKKENIVKTFTKSLKYLFLVSLPIYIFIYFLANPQIIKWIFGQDWLQASQYIRILLPYFFILSVYMPLIRIFLSLEKQNYHFISQILRTFVLLLIYLINKFFVPITFVNALYIFVIGNVIITLIFISVLYFLVKHKYNNYVSENRFEK